MHIFSILHDRILRIKIMYYHTTQNEYEVINTHTHTHTFATAAFPLS